MPRRAPRPPAWSATRRRGPRRRRRRPRGSAGPGTRRGPGPARPGPVAREQPGDPRRRRRQQVPARLGEQRALAVVRADQQRDGVRGAGRGGVERVHRRGTRRRRPARTAPRASPRSSTRRAGCPPGQRRLGDAPSRASPPASFSSTPSNPRTSCRGPHPAAARACRRRPAPLCAIARWNRPLRGGHAEQRRHLIAPADSPKIVTLPGSPPKAAMLSRTHSSAATWSSMPELPTRAAAGRRRSRVSQEAERAEAVVDVTTTTSPRARERVPVVPGRGRDADANAAAVDPHHHRARRRRRWPARLTLRLRQSSPMPGPAARAEQAEPDPLLGRHRPERRRVAHPRPRLRRPGARNRPSPAVDAAYGMPRQARRSSPTATPRTTPAVVRTSRSLSCPRP